MIIPTRSPRPRPRCAALVAAVAALGFSPGCGQNSDAAGNPAAEPSGGDSSSSTQLGPRPPASNTAAATTTSEATAAPPPALSTQTGASETGASETGAPPTVAPPPSSPPASTTPAASTSVETTPSSTAPPTTPVAPAVPSSTAPAATSDPTAACALSADRIRVSEFDVGMRVDTNEDEARLRPLVISPLPSGGSQLAWMGEDGQLHITALNDDDTPTGGQVTLAAHDFADILADDSGGVALLTRDAQGSGDKHCGELTNLCGNVDTLPEQYACWDMYMVRFDGDGETWATQLTESGPDAAPYLSSPTDSGRRVYIWEAYAHHGRLASNGSEFAAYFGAAISVSETCVQADTSQAKGVNIHQGDRMDVVSASGMRLSGAGEFAWGCSHSGYERLTWDPLAARWIAVCKTDNNNRLALAPNYATIRAVDLAANNISDVVLRPNGGYWLAASDVEASGAGLADVMLLGFSISGNQVTLDDELPLASQAGLNERAPYLARYGTDGLVVGWETAQQANDLRSGDAQRMLHLQVLSAASGMALGAAIDVPLPGNRYQSLRSFPDGSVAFPTRGTTETTVRVLRVLPCTE